MLIANDNISMKSLVKKYGFRQELSSIDNTSTSWNWSNYLDDDAYVI